jgi:hypothetical protein
MATNSPTIHIIEEDALQKYKHSAADIEAYATYLGIDLEHERDLLRIAEAGLKEPIPAPWRACQVDGDDDLFYFNFETGESVWDHPSDHLYFKQLEEERARRVHVPVTLALQPGSESGVTVVGTNLAGAVITTVTVQDANATAFGDVENGLRESLSLPAHTVPRFVLHDATLLGHSHSTRSIAELFKL